MKSKYNKLTCLFGHHDYSDDITVRGQGYLIHMCKICGRSGYWKWNNSGAEVWCGYDEEGNLVHVKWDSGHERWKDANGNWIGNSRWIHPDYAKQIQ